MKLARIGWTVVAVLFTAPLASPAVAEDGPAARVFKEDGKVRAENLRTGETHEGDVLVVLQRLVDALGKGDDSPGGRIRIDDGTYITAADSACDLRSGVQVAAEHPRGAVLRMGPSATAGWFFRGRRVENVVVDGLVFDGNRDAHVVEVSLAKDASAGDEAIRVESAAALEGASLGEGRDVWTTPGGFQIAGGGNVERARASVLHVDGGRIELQRPLRHGYAAGDAVVRYYRAIGGVALHGEELTVRRCKFVRTQESPVLFVSGGKAYPGRKLIEQNAVIGHRGDACIRLQRGAYGGVIRDNYVERPHAWYQRFWGEGIALEGNHHSICTGNVIKGPGDRLIRANDADHCVISNNTVRVPTPELLDTAAWSPLRGDERIVEAKAREAGKARPPLRLRGGDEENPGLRARLGEGERDWTATTGPRAGETGGGHYRFNRAYAKVRPSAAGVPVHLRLVDEKGAYADFTARTWAADKRQVLGFDLTAPDDTSSSPLDRTRLAEIHLYLETDADEVELKLRALRRGQRTGWGLTLWGASHTTVSNNTFYGVGADRGTIYYGSGGWSASRELTVTGNTLAYCYDGIGFARQAERRITVSDNTLYATLGGIRGDVVATGNVIAFDSTNASTRRTLTARTATGNTLYMTRGIRLLGDGPASATGNVVLDHIGPGLVLAGDGGVAAHNVLRSEVSGDAAVRQTEEGKNHLVSGNWVRNRGPAFAIRGSGAVVTDNLVETASDTPVRVEGELRRYEGNAGAPLVAKRLTLRPGRSPAGRADGVGSRESDRPTVEAVDPIPETTPDAAYAVDAYTEWDPAAGEWDLILVWKTDPGAPMDVRVRLGR